MMPYKTSNEQDPNESLMSNPDDAEDSYQPPAFVRAFVQKAKDGLLTSPHLVSSPDPPAASLNVSAEEFPQVPPLVEDAQDRELKQEILSRFDSKEQQNESFFSPGMLVSPPPNPANNLNYRQAKTIALEGSTPQVHVRATDPPAEKIAVETPLVSMTPTIESPSLAARVALPFSPASTTEPELPASTAKTASPLTPAAKMTATPPQPPPSKTKETTPPAAKPPESNVATPKVPLRASLSVPLSTNKTSSPSAVPSPAKNTPSLQIPPSASTTPPAKMSATKKTPSPRVPSGTNRTPSKATESATKKTPSPRVPPSAKKTPPAKLLTPKDLKSSVDRLSRPTSSSASARAASVKKLTRASPKLHPTPPPRPSVPPSNEKVRDPPSAASSKPSTLDADDMDPLVSPLSAPFGVVSPSETANTTSPSTFSQPTAASQSRREAAPTPSPSAKPASKGTTGVPSRLLQGTASQARRAAEARAKAHQRVQQRTTTERKKQTTAAAPPETKRRTTTVSAEEGIARARERVRQRKLAQEAGKENAGRPRRGGATVQEPQRLRRSKIGRDRPTLAQSDDAFRNVLRENKSQVTKPSRRSGKPPLTIPVAPKFATTTLHGEPAPLASRGTKTEVTLAQSTDVLRKGLRDDVSVGSTGSSRQRRVTIPHSPHFATTARCGKAQTPTVKKSDMSWAQTTDILKHTLRQDTPASNAKIDTKLTIPRAPKLRHSVKKNTEKSTEEKEKEMMEYFNAHPFKARPSPRISSAPSLRPAPTKPTKRRVLTTPKPFHFSSDNRTTADKTAKKKVDRKSDLTWAQTTDVLKRTLREDTPVSTTMHDTKLTVPKTPNLSHSVKRNLPKSTAEKEAEMMKYYKSHPFKARAYSTSAPRSMPARSAPKRAMTTPQPFRLSLPHSKPSVSPDTEEMKKQFRARPIPNYSRSTRVTRTQRVTTPEPFHLSTSPPPRRTQNDDYTFRARPAPKSTHEPPPMPSPRMTTTTPQPFRLSTSPLPEKPQTNHYKFRARPAPRSTYCPQAL